MADGDNDGLNDGEELAARSDPANPNTDGDQYEDGRDLFPVDPTNNPFSGQTPDATSGIDPMPVEEPVAAAEVMPDATAAEPFDSAAAWPTEEPANDPAPEVPDDSTTLEQEA